MRSLLCKRRRECDREQARKNGCDMTTETHLSCPPTSIHPSMAACPGPNSPWTTSLLSPGISPLRAQSPSLSPLSQLHSTSPTPHSPRGPPRSSSPTCTKTSTQIWTSPRRARLTLNDLPAELYVGGRGIPGDDDDDDKFDCL